MDIEGNDDEIITHHLLNNSCNNNNCQKYTVKADDTLTKIALKFNTSIGELCILNHLSSKMIYPSQVLHIPSNENIHEDKLNEKDVTSSPNRLNASTTSSVNDRSTLYPGTYEPLQLSLPPVRHLNRPYDISVRDGFIKLEASIITTRNIEDKVFVELTLNPTCIGVKLNAITYDENIKSYLATGLFYRNRDAELKHYSIPYKSIESVMFYNALESLFDEEPDDYVCDPVIAGRRSADNASSNLFHLKQSYRTKSSNENLCDVKKSNSKNNSIRGSLDNILSSTDQNFCSHQSLAELPFFSSNRENHSFEYGVNSYNGLLTKFKKFGGCFEPLKPRRSSNDSLTPKSNAKINRIEEYIQLKEDLCQHFNTAPATGVSHEKPPEIPPEIPLEEPLDKPYEKLGDEVSNKTTTQFMNKTVFTSTSASTSSTSKNHKTHIKKHKNIYVLIKITKELSSSCASLIDNCKDVRDESDGNNKVYLEINDEHLTRFREFIDCNLPAPLTHKKESITVKHDKFDETIIDIEQIELDVSLPKMNQQSNILTTILLSQISYYIPSRAVTQPLTLGYSTEIHGSSMSTLYRNMLNFNDVPSILLIKDDQNYIFGAILSCLPRISFDFFGNGECIMFTKSPESPIKFYTWTQKNTYFIKGDNNFLAIGAGRGGYGLWINEDLMRGHSGKCETFDNDILSHDADFNCQVLEIWVFQQI